MGRQPKWSPEEDEGCCRAFLRASEDPIVGANQKMADLEKLVEDEFRALMPDDSTETARAQWASRGGRPIVRRYKQVKAGCLALASKHKVAVAAQISGATSADLERVALMLYNDKCSLSDAYNLLNDEKRDIGPPFPYPSARQWLQSSGVLAELCAESSGSAVKPTTSGSDDEEPHPGDRSTSGEATPRPEGTKKAKRRRAQDDSTHALAEAVASIADSQRNRLKETTRKVNISVMQSPEVLAALRKQFFSQLARDIMKESCASGSGDVGAEEDGDEEEG